VLTRPVCSAQGGFIISPMAGGLRAAGLVELGGTAAPPVAARFDQLEGATRDLLAPGAAAALGDRQRRCDWLGFRPTLPDALPVGTGASRWPHHPPHV
jgi:D-amino-acid dehydrogenase